jgi:hypothetical protein
MPEIQPSLTLPTPDRVPDFAPQKVFPSLSLAQWNDVIRANIVGIDMKLVIVESLEFHFVRNREDGHAQFMATIVQILLHIRRDSVGALVEDGVSRIVEQSDKKNKSAIKIRIKKQKQFAEERKTKTNPIAGVT